MRTHDQALLSVEQCFFARPPGHNPPEPRPPVPFHQQPQLDMIGLRDAISNSQIISRAMLYNLTAKNIVSLPNRAIDCVERILLRSLPPYVAIDAIENETSLCFWKLDEKLQISLQGDWSQLLWLVPDFLNLMPYEIQQIHDARMEPLLDGEALMLGKEH